MNRFEKTLVTIVAGLLGILVFATRASCQVQPTPSAGWQTDAQVTLGMRFVPKQDLNMTGIMYYRGSSATNAVTGQLWRGGTLLASVSIPGTGAGWKSANITPIRLTQGVEYIVSYNTTSYFANTFYFPRSFPLYDAVNSSYRYGAVGFPNLNYQNSNYFVEPILSAIPVAPPPSGRDTIYIRDTIRTVVRDTVRITDTLFQPVLCPDTTWVFADAYDTVGARFPDYQIYGQFEFTMPVNKKVRFVRRIEAVWRREEFIDGQWIEK
jgi:hypothetical protein